MEETDEFTAMKDITETLDALDEETQARVIRWVADKYGLSIRSKDEEQGGAATIKEVESLDELWVATDPQTQPDKVLIVGSWLQVRESYQDLDGYQVNQILKNLGHGVANITKAFGQLIDTRPQLAIQVQKSGTTRQARKKYRITVAGIQRVEGMITGKEEE